MAPKVNKCSKFEIRYAIVVLMHNVLRLRKRDNTIIMYNDKKKKQKSYNLGLQHKDKE